MNSVPVHRHSVTGTVVLAAIVLLAMVWVVQFFVVWDVTGDYFGWNIGTDGSTIISITPDGPAARAGILPGDRIDWRTLPLLGRANLAVPEAAPRNAELSVRVTRAGRERTVTMRSQPFDRDEQNLSRAGCIAQLVLVAIGIALVWLRPSRMTWGFLLFTLYATAGLPVQVLAAAAFGPYVVLHLGSALFYGASVAGLLMFASRFPNDVAAGPLRYLDRLAVPVGVGVSVLSGWLFMAIAVAPNPPPQWAFVIVEQAILPALSVIAILALVVALRQSSGADRQRIFPVLSSLTLTVFATAANQLYSVLYTAGIGQLIVSYAQLISLILLAAAIAHGILRHRVMDFSFVVSRTLVYSAITTLLVGTFALIDFASSKMLEHLQLALLLEALAALAFGVSLNALHSRIDRLIDRLLFRRRHAAEERLRRTSRTLMHAESAGFVDDALVIEAGGALDLASAALFRRDAERYVRVAAVGWSAGDAVELTSDDHMVVNLAAELEPLDLLQVRWPRDDVPKGLAHPILAVPLVVRHELAGFAVYGGHQGGEAIDPDERRALVQLAGSAAAAFDHIRAAKLAADLNALRNENVLLQHEQHLLREMVDALRSLRESLQG